MVFWSHSLAVQKFFPDFAAENPLFDSQNLNMRSKLERRSSRFAAKGVAIWYLNFSRKFGTTSPAIFKAGRLSVVRNENEEQSWELDEYTDVSYLLENTREETTIKVV